MGQEVAPTDYVKDAQTLSASARAESNGACHPDLRRDRNQIGKEIIRDEL